jgi:hypothetical protein
MTRTFIATATAVFGAITLFASAAQACISCEYTPEVVNTPVYSHGDYYHARARVRVRAVVKVPRIRPSKEVAEIERAPKKVESAKAEPVELDVKAENSSISTTSVDKKETAEAKPAPVKEAEASASVGCKKFFPSVGMTLTVPCE